MCNLQPTVSANSIGALNLKESLVLSESTVIETKMQNVKYLCDYEQHRLKIKIDFTF